MKHYRIYFAIAFLILASLACQAIGGSGGGGSEDPLPTSAPNDSLNTEAPQPPAGSDDGNTVETDFPVTEDAYNLTEAGGSLIFYTNMSLEETMDFYRDEYTSRGYTEREILTIVSDGTFSMVFDGDPSGKAVVIQSVDLGDGSRTVSIRLEDV